MFTGLVEEIGRVVSITDKGDGADITFAGGIIMDDLNIDDSVSINGCCLTVTSLDKESFNVTAVQETLKKTSIGDLKDGDAVNLERALMMSDRLGGHFVQGHVDSTGTVKEVIVNDEGWEMWINFPAEFRKWLIPVGSVCVSGVSLTVADLTDDTFKVAIIPHTLEMTTLGKLQPGDRVNLEFDVLAKYMENFAKRA